MTTEIKLIQSPVIQHAIIESGAEVTARINALNIENQVATAETVQALKIMRAELNKEAREFEEQRKLIKEAVLSPYSEFEAVYKAEIIEKYKAADELLKSKINDFEMKIKRQKRDGLIAYFNELCEMEQIDFVKFENAVAGVDLSTPEKKYKEQILSFIQKVGDDLNLISTDNHAAEILVIYKKTLNASQAIQEVRTRKEAEKRESERMIADRTLKRVNEMFSLKLLRSDIARAFVFVEDSSIAIRQSVVESLENEEWNKAVSEIKHRIEAWRETQPKPENKIKPEILKAPVEENPKKEESLPVKEEIYNARFEVSGTYAELMKLGEFLKSNNYNYKNID